MTSFMYPITEAEVNRQVKQYHEQTDAQKLRRIGNALNVTDSYGAMGLWYVAHGSQGFVKDLGDGTFGNTGNWVTADATSYKTEDEAIRGLIRCHAYLSAIGN